MKKLLTITLFVETITLAASAQEQSPIWTMDDCMRYALEHSTTVKKQKYTLSTAEANLQTATAAFLPTLSATIDGQYNWGRSIDPETNTYNNVTTFNNSYGIYASIYLFDGGQTINQWKQAKVNRQIGMSDLQKAKDDKVIEVMQTYVDAVYCKGCLSYCSDKLQESQKTLYKTQKQEELGIKGKPDVAQIKAQVAQDNYNLTHQQNLYLTAILKLKSSMNLPLTDSLSIDTLLQQQTPESHFENATDIYAYASVYNPTARSAALNVKNYQLQYSISKGKLLPTLSLSAGVATDYYRNLSSDTTPSFNNQFKNNRGEYVSATLSIPLFDNLKRINDMRKARNNMRSAIVEKEETMRKLHDDIEQAVMDRDGYAKEIIQMIDKVDADTWAYHVTLRKFEEGMMNAIDLQTSANTLLQSRVTLLQKQMLYVLKNRLVAYYKGNTLITDNK